MSEARLLKLVFMLSTMVMVAGVANLYFSRPSIEDAHRVDEYGNPKRYMRPVKPTQWYPWVFQWIFCMFLVLAFGEG